MDIQLQRCNIRFGNYIFDMGSQGMRKVVKKLIEGITGADEPVKRAHSWTKNKYGEDIIKESLHGVVSQVDMDMLTLFMQELELYETQREECVRKMLQLCDESHSQELELLTGIPGIKTQSAMTILAELGNDLSSFKTASNLFGWAGLRERNEESAGKIKSRQTMHGNKFLRVILVQCVWANTRSKTSKPGRKHALLVKRMSPKKALVAIAGKLLVIIWNVLTKQEPYKA